MTEQTCTVVEFAAKHCTAHENTTADALNTHVNAIILAALVRNRALWEVVVDSDGRASLIWVSLPDFVWEALLREGADAQALMALLGGLS